MQVDVTVRTPRGEQDVRLSGPDDTTDAALIAAALAAAVDDHASRPAEQIAAQVTVRDGVLLGVGPPERADDAPLRLEVTGGRSAGRWAPVLPGPLVVGRGSGCALRLDDARVSRRHAEVRANGRSVTVRNLRSTNGVQLAGAPVGPVPVPLPVGVPLVVGDSQLMLRRRDGSARRTMTAAGPHLVVGPTARESRPTPPEPVEMPERPARSARRLVGFGVAALVPALAVGLVALVTGSTSLLPFALLGPVTVLAGVAAATTSAGAPAGRSRRRAVARRAHDQVAAALREEAADRRHAAPDAAEVAHIATLPGRRLWERDSTAPDFLQTRLGAAAQPSRLQVRRGGRTETAGTVDPVPVVVELTTGALGIVGPARPVRALARFVLVQAAVLHPPSTLPIALLVPPGTAWHWARWLPHLSGRVATDEPAAARVWADIAAAGSQSRPLTVVDALDGAAGRGAIPGASTSHVVCLAPDADSLPVACRAVVRFAGADASIATLTVDGGEPQHFAVDLVDEEWAERIARTLAPLRGRAEASTTAADLTALLGVDLDPHAIGRRWRQDPLGLAAAIGTGPTGPLVVDLATHGPHALIAGTTGSGKSALLRTLVLGLALTRSPADVGFLLVDYKGGAAFAACADLPHTTGVVTDLDAPRTRRALRSLDAEIRRRERLLADAGAADYVAYRSRPGRPPLGRLVIVVDEFATLADELPDFVRGLVDVAQRGRSLGLHLVLATQRPGRAVTPEIRANTGLRIALRVTDPAESIDVVGVPDAAFLPAGQPGRGVLSVAGSELVGFTVAVPRRRAEGVRAQRLGPWRRPATTRRCESTTSEIDEAVAEAVRCLRDAARVSGLSRAPAPWLPPLPADLRADLRADSPLEPGSGIRLGLVDVPDRQAQVPFTLDLDAGHGLLLCGAARTGRSEALLTAATLAAAHYPPRQLQLYAVDRLGALGARLAALPHLAAGFGAGDPGLLARLLHRLREPGSARRLLLLDDWDAVCAEAGEVRAAELHGALADLLRAAASRRLTVIAATSALPPPSRHVAGFTDTLLLRLADAAQYALAGVAPADVPRQLSAGRGVRARDGAEVQLAWLGGAAATHIRQAAARWSDGGLAGDALRFRPLPDTVSLSACGSPGTVLRLGLGGDETAVVGVDPAGGHLVVAGSARSGRSTALRVLLQEARRVGLPVVAAAPRRSPLWAAGAAVGAPLVPPDAPAADLLAGTPGATRPTLLLVDDYECFDGSPAGEHLLAAMRRGPEHVVAVVAGRGDAMVTAYRGVAAEARSNRRGVLLQPTALDGELLGIRLERGGDREHRPGRGVAVGLSVQPPTRHAGDAIALQVAQPDDSVSARTCGGTGDRSPAPSSP